jgi:lactoylglutathione lyase
MNGNVKQAVPFFHVTDMERSLRFYCDGLGAERTKAWTPEGRIRWCWLQFGDAALMLQEYLPNGAPEGKLGVGAPVCFLCEDALALYHSFLTRGVAASRPFVGNGLWVTSVTDPDGYRLDFESPTDVEEETIYAG